MLSINNIDVIFGSNHVLRNVTCHANHGDFVVIVGANGAGKSTLFDTIAGKIKPSRGSITVDSHDITAHSEQYRAGLITRIFQNTRLNSVGSLTVAQNLSFAHYSRRYARFVHGMDAFPSSQAEHLVKELGMSPAILDQPMNHLSGGQRQLLAFAMATAHIPKILLLDEPTAALDPHAATKLLIYAAQFIKRHHITTLLITHDPHIALSMGNKVWILDNGTISHEFGPDKKHELNPDKLIGQIDYAQIAASLQ